ncbi:MAG: hypothetical protein J5926_07725, partial [Ruminococcus sp.]|nr:hypothetical protein [Ruminococcus sp.]
EDGERGPIKPKQKSAFPSPPPPVGFPLWTLFSLNLHLLTLCLLLLFSYGLTDTIVERQLSKGERSSI